MNDDSVIHFSKVSKVLGGLLLPGKNINNSFTDASRKIKVCSLDQIVESKKNAYHNIFL